MNEHCSNCGLEFTFDRFQPDRVLCQLCAEDMNCDPDGSDKEKDDE